ncbi:MAG: hypothetical protein R3246_17665 [Acidimicrobiia bacterium]|nr:hypothetical protein [Acidimicrobiia bacterium]
MNRSSKVRTTKTQQTAPAAKVRRPGRPTNGGNTIAPREMSSKKSARKAAGRGQAAGSKAKGARS